MAFTVSDKSRLIEYLKLPKEQAIPGSILESLLKATEDFDDDYGTTYVADIQDALDSIESIQSDLAAQSSEEATNISRVRVGEYEVEYKSGEKSGRIVAGEKIGFILRTVDPDGALTQLVAVARPLAT